MNVFRSNHARFSLRSDFIRLASKRCMRADGVLTAAIVNNLANCYLTKFARFRPNLVQHLADFSCRISQNFTSVAYIFIFDIVILLIFCIWSIFLYYICIFYLLYNVLSQCMILSYIWIFWFSPNLHFTARCCSPGQALLAEMQKSAGFTSFFPSVNSATDDQ